MQEWSKKSFLNSDNEEAWSIVKKLQHSLGSRKDCVWEGKPMLKCLPAQGKQCRRMKGQTAQLAKTAWGTDIFHQTNFESDGDGGEALKHDAINHRCQSEELWQFLLHCVFIGNLLIILTNFTILPNHYSLQVYNLYLQHPKSSESQGFFKTYVVAKPKLICQWNYI